MDSSVHQLVTTVILFQQLLLRYATYLVRNKLAASLIVEEVITEYCLSAKLIAPSDTRTFLQNATREKCRAWLAAKPATLHLRKPKNPT